MNTHVRYLIASTLLAGTTMDLSGGQAQVSFTVTAVPGNVVVDHVKVKLYVHGLLVDSGYTDAHGNVSFTGVATPVEPSNVAVPIRTFIRLSGTGRAPEIIVGTPQAATLECKIFSITGELVRRLKEGVLSPGQYSLAWDCRNDQGRKVSSGTYFASVEIGAVRHIQKMAIVDGIVTGMGPGWLASDVKDRVFHDIQLHKSDSTTSHMATFAYAGGNTRVAPDTLYFDLNGAASFNVLLSRMFTITGRVTNLFTDQGLNAAKVEYGGYTAIADSDGSYILPFVPPAVAQRVTFSKDSAYYTRQEYPRILLADTVWDRGLADTSLHMDWVSATLRTKSGANGGTIRWEEVPMFVIDTTAALNPNGTRTPITQEEKVLSVQIIMNSVPIISNGLISAPTIIITDSTGRPGVNTPSTIVYSWDNTSAFPATSYTKTNSTNQITYGQRILHTGLLPTFWKAYLLGLILTHGVTNISVLQGPSVMNDANVDYLTVLDQKLLKFLYSRPARNLTPDTAGK
jgi:hypothetical protein